MTAVGPGDPHRPPGHRHRAGRRVPALRVPPRGRARPGWLRPQRLRRRAHRRRGRAEQIAELTRLLVDDAPPLARVASVVAERAPPIGPRRRASASSRATHGGAPDVPVSIDSATCADCLAEVDDPADRRHRYPFTNCTNCGPRYTIVLERAVRPAGHDDGRLHDVPGLPGRVRRPGRPPVPRPAQRLPGVRPAAGLAGPHGRRSSRRVPRALAAAVGRASRAARILAVKGIGGYHLAVDATDAAAVAELRRRKARDDKPFAVMVADAGRRRPAVRPRRRRPGPRSTSPRRPIVLAPRRPGGEVVDGVAPGLPELGLLLPYSPLHHLLLAGVGRPLVMTSGNLSDEPIAHDDDDAGPPAGPHGRRAAHPRPADPHPLRRLGRAGRAGPAAGAAPVPGLRARAAARCPSPPAVPCSPSAPS